MGFMSVMDVSWLRLSSLMFGLQIFDNLSKSGFLPYELRSIIQLWSRRVIDYFYRYIEISFDELIGPDYWKPSQAYTLIEAYLGPKNSNDANRMKGQLQKRCKNLSFSLDDAEQVVDWFQGIEVSWFFNAYTTKNKYLPEKRYLTLKFHRNHRETIMNCYLNHVLKEGKKITKQNSCIKLYSNNPVDDCDYGNRKLWSKGEFDHPISFKHLAMDPKKKQAIIDDLITFSKGKDYYAKIGKPWKRGYLLYGPPGTGKSSMIAAMSNLLQYDVYDIELTAVQNNSDLRKLLQNTTDKSIMVIEDIDCSLDLAGKRMKDKKEKKRKKSDSNLDDQKTKVTLSGLLNFIDGLWSACGKERIIVFTTNYLDKLDPALIRRGRMDKHIEMSYCCFEGFKILATNYLCLDSHVLFERIRSLIGEVQITPADVAEHLIPKTMDMNAEECLKSLIQALENAKDHEKGMANQVLDNKEENEVFETDEETEDSKSDEENEEDSEEQTVEEIKEEEKKQI
ncbi:hypothetical protein MKW92_041723 [Papaver armeniacum]|nr:hypothetical protein MKW92_041723 [Papaver armeniacum]